MVSRKDLWPDESGEDRLKALRMLVALAVLAAPVVADAHGPTRQKVTKTVRIDAPPAAVWDVVKDFGNMQVWHPAVEKDVAQGGNAVGATRVLTLKGGGEIQEKLEKYSEEGMSFTYRITEVNIDVLPVANYTSTVTVTAGAGGGSDVEWRGAFYRGYMLNDPPDKYNDESARNAVAGVYEAGLNNLKTVVESRK